MAGNEQEERVEITPFEAADEVEDITKLVDGAN